MLNLKILYQKKPQKPTDPYTLIVIFDIDNLYSNISHTLGKPAISFWTEKCPGILYLKFNKQFITDGIELILINKVFQFENINYIETIGTPLRTKMAPTYAA